MRIRVHIICGIVSLVFSAFFIESCAQEKKDVRFVFYNVENLFDLVDDSLTSDGEFTPEGDKHWSQARYHKKLDNIARTMTAVGGWELPGIIGLCEIENRDVLIDLVQHRLLAEHQYGIIHRNSPDRRGIDVALLYDQETFIPDTTIWIPIQFSNDPGSTTRDILYVKGLIFGTDTLHLFINHWPSRWGGVEATIPKRVEVASVLRQKIDSLFVLNPQSNILIAGDLNDNPVDSSVFKVLRAQEEPEAVGGVLQNLMFPAYRDTFKGSLKYKLDWEVYDQIIVSSSLLFNNGLHVKNNEAYIFTAPFLLTEDERYSGQKPFRTYAGPRYLDGFSDHLPVFLDLVK